MSVPGRHVGEDDLVADFKALSHFNAADGGSAEFHRHPHGVATSFHQLEQADGALRLALDRASDVEDIVQPLQLDGAVHAQVGPGASGQGSFEFNVHRHRSVYHGRVDADDPAWDHAVAGVDHGDLTDENILGLGLR